MFANRLKCPQCGTLYDMMRNETEHVQDKRTFHCQICNSLLVKRHAIGVVSFRGANWRTLNGSLLLRIESLMHQLATKWQHFNNKLFENGQGEVYTM